MLSPEQEVNVRLEVVRLVASTGTPAEKLMDIAIPLSEWLLKCSHSQPSSTDDKA